MKNFGRRFNVETNFLTDGGRRWKEFKQVMGRSEGNWRRFLIFHFALFHHDLRPFFQTLMPLVSKVDQQPSMA